MALIEVEAANDKETLEALHSLEQVVSARQIEL